MQDFDGFLAPPVMLDDLTQGNGGRHVNLQLMIYEKAVLIWRQYVVLIGILHSTIPMSSHYF